MRTGTERRTVDGLPIPAPGVLAVDPAHSSIEAVVRHLVIAKVRGRFTSFGGLVHVAEDPMQSWAEVTIDAASIDTGEPDRDEHLRSADFLDVKRYPTIEFRTTFLSKTGRGRFQSGGDLTMRGSTHPVVVECEYRGLATDLQGNERLVLTAESEIDRTRWGLTWNQALETGGVVVSAEVQVQAEIQAVRQP
ncbi:MAG TPA: YceI family protein [Actinomycetota bacterium]